MSPKIEPLPKQATPNIDEVLALFLEEQRKRLKQKTIARYESALELLRNYLNGYAYQNLSKAEARLFDRHFNADGDEHREYTQLFGPGKILEHVDGVLGHFMVAKVIAGKEFKRNAATVTNKLVKWLAANGYASTDAANEGAKRSREAGQHLATAEEAAQRLHDAADRRGIDTLALSDDDYEEFDHFTIARVEPGRLWLDVWEGGEARARGPISAPKEATKLLREGWDVSCALARVRGKWHLVEVANVYPT